MVEIQNTIRNTFITQMKGIAESNKQIGHFNKNFRMKELASENARAVSSMFGTFEKKKGIFQRMIGSITQFRMEFLGLLFFGMAMMRMFSGLITSAFQTFKKITDGTDMANNSVTGLLASWEFFKFSLFQALQASPLFQKIVAWLTKITTGFADLSPKMQNIIANSIIWGAIIGGILFLAATLVLGFSSIVKIIVNIVYLFGLMNSLLKKSIIFSNLFNNIWGRILKLVSFGGGGLIGAMKLIGLIGGLVAVIAVAIMLRKKFGSWADAMKAWAAAIVLAISWIVQGLVNVIQIGLNYMIERLKEILEMAKDVAKAIGALKSADRLSGAISALTTLQNKKIDVVGNVAGFLDSAGFNPQPVSNQGVVVNQTNEFDLGDTKSTDELLIELEDVQTQTAERLGQGIYSPS